MEKEIYTKQELVDNAVESCKAIIRNVILERGYISVDKYCSIALMKIDALWHLNIITVDEWRNLRMSMDNYCDEQNYLSTGVIPL